MHKDIQKYAKICSDQYFSYAFMCTKYAKTCKICRHVQKYALPTLLMPGLTSECVGVRVHCTDCCTSNLLVSPCRSYP